MNQANGLSKIIVLRNQNVVDDHSEPISLARIEEKLCERLFDSLIHKDFPHSYEIIHKYREEQVFENGKVSEDFYLNRVKVIIVFSELSWNDCPMSDYYGFRIVRRLREENVKQPIFICSFHSREALLKSENSQFEVLRTPGHTLIELPLESPIPLPEFSLELLTKHHLNDIKSFAFNIREGIAEVFHDLKNQLRDKDLKPSWESKLEKAFRSVRKRLSSVSIDKQAQLDEIVQEVKTELPNASNRDDYLSQIPFKIYGLFPEIDDNQDEQIKEITEWGVLFIDDEVETVTRVRSLFAANGIKRCFPAYSGKEAFELLTRDSKGELTWHDEEENVHRRLPPNFITVVISDLRFKTLEGDWHYWQGLPILEKIHQDCFNLVSLFALTSKRGGITSAAQHTSMANISWYYKGNVLNPNEEKGFSVFADAVRFEGSKLFLALCQKPSGRYWREVWQGRHIASYWHYYNYHRMSKEYFDVERKINEDADTWTVAARKGDKSIGTFHYTGGYSPQLTKYPGDVNTMDKFFALLAIRRAVLWLYRCESWNSEQIEEFFRDGKSTDNSFYPSHLGLSKKLFKDVPSRLLVEERIFLEEKGDTFEKDAEMFWFQTEKYIEAIVRILLNPPRESSVLKKKMRVKDKDKLKTVLIELKEIYEDSQEVRVKKKMDESLIPFLQSSKIGRDILYEYFLT